MDEAVDRDAVEEVQAAHGVAAVLDRVVGVGDRLADHDRGVGGLDDEATCGRVVFLEGLGDTRVGSAGGRLHGFTRTSLRRDLQVSAPCRIRL